ncbi:MAG TPA: hypothetical protein VJC18_04590 [bacterium]|nr:hypothetical protein [bacterium]
MLSYFLGDTGSCYFDTTGQSPQSGIPFAGQADWQACEANSVKK